MENQHVAPLPVRGVYCLLYLGRDRRAWRFEVVSVGVPGQVLPARLPHLHPRPQRLSRPRADQTAERGVLPN